MTRAEGGGRSSWRPPITSVSNPIVKEVVRLRDRRHRDRTRTFLVEGFREVRRALEAGADVERLFYCPPLYLGRHEPEVTTALAASGTTVIEMSEAAFRKISYRDRPEGLLGVVRQFPTGLDRVPLRRDSLLLVAERIEKPGNLGTMLRTADAAGASVVVCDPTTDPFNPNVVRASVGMLFTVPLAVTSTAEAVPWLRGAGIKIVATSPEAGLTFWQAELREGVAVVVGSEQYGLSEPWLDVADQVVRIPMAGATDSLNAAVAAALTLFEAVRQRAAEAGNEQSPIG